MALFQRTRQDRVSRLREVLTASRASEDLSDLPDRFATIIERYDRLDVEPKFRQDVHAILQGAIQVAEAMVDATFPVEHAGTMVATQMEVIARVLRYLQSRPATTGFALLLPETGVLVGQFNTREEAEENRTRMVGLGISASSIVVPTKVLSQHAIQPRHRAPVRPRTDFDSPEVAAGPLPTGIIPVDKPPASAPVEMLDVPDEDATPQAPPAPLAQVPFTFQRPVPALQAQLDALRVEVSPMERTKVLLDPLEKLEADAAALMRKNNPSGNNNNNTGST